MSLRYPGRRYQKHAPRLGRGGHTYTPKKTAAAERRIAAAFRGLGEEPIEGALAIYIECTFAPPASWSKKRKAAAMEGQIKKTSKPDVDNLAKTICDALNGVAWKDDSQITRLVVSKKYEPDNETKIRIMEDVW